MRRSGFKQKATVPMRRTPLRHGKTVLKRSKLRKTSKAPLARIQRKIWAILRQIAIERFGSTCYTCGATNLEGNNRQLGHMWAKASVGAYLKYDLRILRIQCFRCNINFGGQGAIFYAKMLKEIGESNMWRLEQDRNVIVKARDHYEKLLKELNNE